MELRQPSSDIRRECLPGQDRKRILFVDDEPAILAGIQNALRIERKRWDVVVAVGAESALAMLAATPTDVVVTDMRMPRMDGVALLSRMRIAHPEVVRIVLSGHAEMSAMLKAIPLAHVYLSKPCDSPLLRAAIDHACLVIDALPVPSLRRAIGAVERLPSTQKTREGLREALARVPVDMARITSIVSHDVAVAARAMQLASSPLLLPVGAPLHVEKALAQLGETMTKQLLSAEELIGQPATFVPEEFLRALQRRSVAASLVARELLPGTPLGEGARTAALLADIGRLVLATQLPGEVSGLAAESGAEDPTCAVEVRNLAADHARIGAYLLGLWGLPRATLDSVRYHHEPSVAPDITPMLAAVHVATALVSPRPFDFDRSMLQYLPDSPADDRLRAMADAAFERTSAELSEP